MSPRGGIGLAAAAIIVAIAALGAATPGCGGPPDIRPPVEHADAGTGGRRTIDASREVVGSRPDAGTIIDTGIDVSWPSIPGCTTGLPPSPQFTPAAIPPITVSCAGSSPLLTVISDAAGQGLLFTATLDPPINNFLVTRGGDLCFTGGVLGGAPILLFVNQSAALPGNTFFTNLRVTLMGPPQPDYVLPLTMKTAPIDFTIDPDVVDFGTAYLGTQLQMPLTVTNAADGAPFANLYATQPQQQGVFTIYPIAIGPILGSGLQPALQPGESQPMLNAVLDARTLGTFESTLLVSPFMAGVPVDPSCGVIRTVTLRAQVVARVPPPPM